jgi:hypothetical protein
MNFIAKNIEIIKNKLGYSYQKLADKISFELPEGDKYSKDQAFNYAKGKPTPPLFIERLSEISGIPVETLKREIINSADVRRNENNLKIAKKDIGTNKENLLSINAQLKTLFKRIALIESRDPKDYVKKSYEAVVLEMEDSIKQEIKQMMDELKNS